MLHILSHTILLKVKRVETEAWKTKEEGIEGFTESKDVDCQKTQPYQTWGLGHNYPHCLVSWAKVLKTKTTYVRKSSYHVHSWI